MDLGELDAFDLMSQVKAGNHEAFAELVQRYQQSLLNFFCRMGAHREEAEDLTQETFLRLYAYHPRYHPSARFNTFLFTLARHVWADNVRKLKKWSRIGREPSLWPETDDKAAARVEARMDIQTALDSLPEKLRVVVVMSIYEGLRYQDIAEILDIPVGTVKSRVFIALKQLRGKLDANAEREP